VFAAALAAASAGAAMSGAGRIYAVRHGESVWNVEGRHQGQSLAAPGLTDIGRVHAAGAAERLATSRVDLVFTSDLRRAVETARLIAAQLGVEPLLEPRLRERSFGVLEGRLIANSGPLEVGVTDDAVTDADARPPGGESIRELYARVIGLVSELAAEQGHRRIVLVSHGGPLRVIRAYLAGTPVDSMSWSAVANGTVLEIPLAAPGLD
jgi:broad specificity phosphatase PhoE